MTWSPRNKSADKRDSVSKTSKYPSGGDVNHSVSSNEDDESMQIDEIGMSFCGSCRISWLVAEPLCPLLY